MNVRNTLAVVAVMVLTLAAQVAAAEPVRAEVRPGLLQALQRRASFTRAHDGAFASMREGDRYSSAAWAAQWNAGERAYFAWHQDGDRIVFAAFDVRGRTIAPPQVIGRGRWPRICADVQRIAVAWNVGDGFVVRVRDGESWGPEMPLSGTEASIALAPDGSVHAATTSGLWKTNGPAFERVNETPYAQPALALDEHGRPHVASVQDGKVVLDGKEIDAGERPALSMRGGARLAYVRDGKLILRTLNESGEAILEAKDPAWPALAHDREGGARPTYFAAAAHGPEALWLVRPPDMTPVLVPSLAGNVTEAWLVVNFSLRYALSRYRPHDVEILCNGVRVGEFRNAIPQGRYVFPLEPRQIFTSAGAPVTNRISIHTRHMNPGHYAVSSDYQMIVRTDWSERYALVPSTGPATTMPADARFIHDQHDLALLANDLKLSNEQPHPGKLPLTVTVANLGEADAPAARVELVHEDEVIHQAEVSPLKPSELQPVTIDLDYDGSMRHLTLRIAQASEDCDPENDQMKLFLWERAPETGGIAGAGIARDVPAQPEPTTAPKAAADAAANVRLDWPRAAGDLWRWELVHPDRPEEIVAFGDDSRRGIHAPPGTYRLVLRPTAHDNYSGRLVWPEPVEVNASGETLVRVTSGVRLSLPKDVTDLWRWELVRADKPDDVVQWHAGDRLTMIAPPGAYRIALRPTGFDNYSARLVLPQELRVEPDQIAEAKVDSGARLDAAEAAGDIWRWEIVRAGRPDDVVQWHAGDLTLMLLPPGEYQLAIRPTGFDNYSGRLLWPEKLRVEPGQFPTVRVQSMICLELPERVKQMWRWEAVPEEKPDQVVQWHAGDRRAMLVPPGKYRIALRPSGFDNYSQRLVWPTVVEVKADQPAVLKVHSGVQLKPAAGVDAASADFRFIDAGSKNTVQWCRGTEHAQLLPPGTYRIEARRNAMSDWGVVVESVTVEEGKLADVPLERLPGR